MQMNGEYVLPADRQAVWNALNNPEVLAACIPNCQSFEKISESEFAAAAKVKIGPVGATFKGQVELSDLDPPNGYRISGQGTGGVAGFANGGAVVTLSDDAETGGTKLIYEVDAKVGGKIAQLGQRLVNGAAKKMADQFFENFRKALDPEANAEADAKTTA